MRSYPISVYAYYIYLYTKLLALHLLYLYCVPGEESLIMLHTHLLIC